MQISAHESIAWQSIVRYTDNSVRLIARYIVIVDQSLSLHIFIELLLIGMLWPIFFF